MIDCIETPKKPGDLVLGTNGALFIVNGRGHQVAHEQPHRRAQRERAEAYRQRIAVRHGSRG